MHRDGKGHSGYCFAIGDHDTAMLWSRSYKQKTVATSSTEAEVAAGEIIWFRDLMQELGFPQTQLNPLWCMPTTNP